jgi:hypothetical protein
VITTTTRQRQQDAARVRHPARHGQPHQVAEGHLAHSDELAWVELLFLPSLAAGGEEVVPRPAEVPVVTHLAKIEQLLRQVAGLFGELARGAARECLAGLNAASRQLRHHAFRPRPVLLGQYCIRPERNCRCWPAGQRPYAAG